MEKVKLVSVNAPNQYILDITLDALKKYGRQSTYKIAKLTGVGWSTIVIALYHLETIGKVKMRIEKRSISQTKKMWELVN